MKRTPVSVVIPCYRCAETIERAVVSVINQTALPTEILLVDDASSDDGRTVSKLMELRERYLDIVCIKVITLPKNGGPSVARNVGWDAATQPYVAFLDADDSWHPRKLEIQYRWMKDHPETDISGHRCVWVRPGDNLEAPILKGERYRVRRVTKVAMLLSNRLPTRSVMLKRSLPFRFNPLKRHSEDYLLWLQIILSGHNCDVLEIPLAYLYKAPYGQGGLSGDLWDMEKGELDTFFRLYKEGYISLPLLAFLLPLSIIKFFRRIAVAGLRRIGEVTAE